MRGLRDWVRESATLGMFPEPRRVFLINHSTRSKSQSFQHHIAFYSIEFNPISTQKQESRHEPGPFVSVHEGMIFYDAARVSRSQVINRRLFISKKVLWPVECRFKKSIISDARTSSVFCEEPFMHRKKDVLPEPDRFFHLASSRRAFR